MELKKALVVFWRGTRVATALGGGREEGRQEGRRLSFPTCVIFSPGDRVNQQPLSVWKGMNRTQIASDWVKPPKSECVVCACGDSESLCLVKVPHILCSHDHQPPLPPPIRRLFSRTNKNIPQKEVSHAESSRLTPLKEGRCAWEGLCLWIYKSRSPCLPQPLGCLGSRDPFRAQKL